MYKKEDSEDSLFPGVSKKTSRKNSRNERRNSKAKVLTHNPEIFSQFGSFGLKPPTSTKDIVCVIDGLKKKQVKIIIIFLQYRLLLLDLNLLLLFDHLQIFKSEGPRCV